MPEKELESRNNYFLKIVICEIICVCLVLACVFVSKLFFKKEYNDFFSLYEKYALINTDVKEVIDN